MTEKEFNNIMDDLVKFGKDLGLIVNFQKSSNNVYCIFWHPEVNMNIFRFSAYKIYGKICNLKIILNPFKIKNTRSIYLDESKLKTFNFKKYMKAYLLSYRYFKINLEKQHLDKEFEVCTPN